MWYNLFFIFFCIYIILAVVHMFVQIAMLLFLVVLAFSQVREPQSSELKYDMI